MKNYKYYLLLYFILWIVLFEFILPVNSILPKPSIVLISFEDLWTDYNLPLNFLSTISAIYLSLLAAYLLVRFLVSNLVKPKSALSDFILSLEWFAEFVPGIVIGLLLVYWFPGSEFIEYIFAFLTAFASLMIKLQAEVNTVPGEYINSAASLGVKENYLNRYVVWKSIQPALMEHIIQFHFYLWTLMIAFEFIKCGYGVGSLFRTALEYKDLSAIFSTFIITGLFVYFGSLLLKYLKNKFYSWSVN